MKIILAPNSFKGTLSSAEAVKWMEKGVKDACEWCGVISLPLADGGDGTLEVVHFYIGGRFLKVRVHDPLGREREAELLEGGDSVWVELSSASGMKLLKSEELNPLITTTYGTGELLRYALSTGKKVFLAVGGSATVDGGAGILAALGVKFIDVGGKEFIPAGGNLHRIGAVKIPAELKRRGRNLVILSDVENPLLGESGAAHVYAPQKGAGKEDVELLERNLSYFAKLTQRITGVNPENVCCGGAAGGVPAFLSAFLGAEVRRGSEEIIKISGLVDKLRDEEIKLVITGEGRIDEQSFYGKIPGRVLEISKDAGKKVAAISGVLSYSESDLFEKFDILFPIVTDFVNFEFVLKNSGPLLRMATQRVVSIFLNISKSQL